MHPAIAAAFLLQILATSPLGGPPFARAEWSFLPALPQQRSNDHAAMMFDAPRHRMLLFGGSSFEEVHSTIWSRSLDGSSRWTPLPAEGAPLLAGFSPTAILDARGNRILIWDGSESKLWTVRIGATLQWSSRTVTGGPIDGAGIALDEARRRLVAFGGGDIASRGDAEVRTLPIDTEAGVWTRMATIGVGPTGRKAAIAVIDAVNDRLLVHGGEDFTYTGPHVVRGDLWQLSLSTWEWTPLFTSDDRSDLCYTGHTGVIDPVRRRLLFFGGDTGDNDASTHAEVRAYSLDGPGVWSVAVAPDAERQGVGGGVAAAYDPESDAVIEYQPLFGGPAHSTHRLALASATWTALESFAVRPSARCGQATAFDPVRRQWVSFGGRYSYDGGNLETTTYNDLWSLKLVDRPEWANLPPPVVAPPGRQDARLVDDLNGDRMILFGGQVTTGVERTFPHRPGLGTPHFYGDTWVLSRFEPPTWVPVAGPGPAPRDGHLMVLDARRHRILLFGGRDSLGGRNDLWSLSLDHLQWTPLVVHGPGPSPRWQAVGAYDREHDRLVVSGGFDGTSLGDTWVLELGQHAPVWQTYPTRGTPPTVGSASRGFVYDESRRRLLVFGDARSDQSEPVGAVPVWSLTLGHVATWDSLALPTPAPLSRYGMGVALDPVSNLVLLTGGANDPKGTNGPSDPWLLDLDALTGPRGRGRVDIVQLAEAETEELPVDAGFDLETPQPNPTSHGAQVRFDLPRGGTASVDLFDVQGRRCESHQVIATRPGRQQIAIGNGLAPGVYLVRLTQQGSMRWRRLAVVR